MCHFLARTDYYRYTNYNEATSINYMSHVLLVSFWHYTNCKNFEFNFYDLSGIQHEIIMHRVFNCDYILDYLSTFMSGCMLWVVMPLQGYGSCMDMLQAHFTHGLPELVIALILKQVLKALIYLHDCGVIHR